MRADLDKLIVRAFVNPSCPLAGCKCHLQFSMANLGGAIIGEVCNLPSISSFQKHDKCMARMSHVHQGRDCGSQVLGFHQMLLRRTAIRQCSEFVLHALHMSKESRSLPI